MLYKTANTSSESQYESVDFVKTRIFKALTSRISTFLKLAFFPYSALRLSMNVSLSYSATTRILDESSVARPGASDKFRVL